MSNTWIVLGCGPSASEDLARARVLAPEAKIATVNMGTRLLGDRLPHAYGTFEADSFQAYRGTGERLWDLGVPVYTTRRNAMRSAATAWRVVHGASIPDGLQHLRDWSRFFEGPDPVGINAGVLMLLLVAWDFSPRRILACGLNGYAPAAEYDRGLADAYARFGARDPLADVIANQQMGADVEAITRHYAATDFVFMTRPLFWRETWRATVAPEVVAEPPSVAMAVVG